LETKSQLIRNEKTTKGYIIISKIMQPVHLCMLN